MTFVQVAQSLVTHRKTLRLTRLLGIDRYAVVGRLVALWSWCLDNALDGCLGDIETDILADVMGWDGKPADLLEGLLTAGFVELREDGHLWVHDWHEHMGGYIEGEERRRQSNRERQQRWRDTHQLRNAEHNAPVTVTPALRNADITGQIREEEEKRPEEKISAAIVIDEADVGGVGDSSDGDDGFGGNDGAQSLAVLCAQVTKAAHLNGHDPGSLARCLTRYHARASPADLIAEAGKAAEWLRDHPGKSMTVRYLDNWLQRAFRDEEGNTSGGHGANGRRASSNSNAPPTAARRYSSGGGGGRDRPAVGSPEYYEDARRRRRVAADAIQAAASGEAD